MKSRPTEILFLLIALCAFHSPAVGQSFRAGYIRTLDDHVTYGYVQENLNEQQFRICRFKESDLDSVHVYTPDQLSGYTIITRKEFHSQNLSGTSPAHRTFCEVLAVGKAKLVTAFDKYYLSFNDSSTIELTRQNYRQTLSKVLQGCQYAVVQIKSLRYNTESLVQLVNDYNKCPDGVPGKFAPAPKSERRIKVIGMFGVETLSLNQHLTSNSQSTANHQAFNDQSPVKYGIMIQKSLSKRISFRSGFFYKQNSFHTDETSYTTFAPIPSSSVVNDFTMKFTEIQVPIVGQYKLLQKGSFGLFVRCGLTLPFISGFSNEENKYYFGNNAPQRQKDPVNSLTMTPRLNIQIGSTINISKNLKIVLEVHRDSGQGKMNFNYGISPSYLDHTTTFSSQSISFLAGLMF